MMPPATAPASFRTDRTPSPEAVLLEALATVGESLTYAIVHHDLDAIVAASSEAEGLMARLVSRQAARPEAAAGEPDPGPPDRLDPPDPAVVLLGARIGATARRNALLLEHAWATDAALLRILATAARSEAEAARGTGYACPAAPPPADAIPAGWLDRQA